MVCGWFLCTEQDRGLAWISKYLCLQGQQEKSETGGVEMQWDRGSSTAISNCINPNYLHLTRVVQMMSKSQQAGECPDLEPVLVGCLLSSVPLKVSLGRLNWASGRRALSTVVVQGVIGGRRRMGVWKAEVPPGSRSTSWQRCTSLSKQHAWLPPSPKLAELQPATEDGCCQESLWHLEF